MLNIKEYVSAQKEALKEKIKTLEKKPSLAIIQVDGFSEASDRYVKNKIRDCEEVGIECHLYLVDKAKSTSYMCGLVAGLDEDGIIVQLPLPSQMDVKKITDYIPLEKDVDGFKPGSPFNPCTPQGIINYLEASSFNFDGINAVVLGRSEIVGKPMARLLLEKNCTVSVCHSHTPIGSMRQILEHANLVVCAVGKKDFIRPSIAPNAFIVDVGINFDENGKMCGDVTKTEKSLDRVTPVPGGVGLLTRLALLENVVKSSV